MIQFQKDSSFSKELRAEVSRYFSERNLSRKGTFKAHFKVALLLSSFWSIYAALLLRAIPDMFSIFIVVVLSLVALALGLNLFHESSHNNLFQTQWMNRIASKWMDIFGINTHMYRFKHMGVHHRYTNIPLVDGDITETPIIRMHPDAPRWNIHKYQSYYWVLLYPLVTLSWIWLDDYMRYQSRQVTSFKMRPFKPSEHIDFWLFKSVHLLVFLGLPSFFFPFHWVLFGYVAFHSILGFFISLIFQLAHVVETSRFPSPTNGTIDQDWMLTQLQETTNFYTQNRFFNYFMGGLNFQIEHHLFPEVNYDHFPEISKIVQRVCKKHGVEYNNLPSLSEALASHIATLAHFSRDNNEFRNQSHV